MAISDWEKNPDGHWEVIGGAEWFLCVNSKAKNTTSMNVVNATGNGSLTIKGLDTRSASNV
jgi:hypothetical protein